MIEIDNFIISIPPIAVVAIVIALLSLSLVFVRYLAGRLRTRGARLAILAASRDFPGEKVLSSSVSVVDGKSMPACNYPTVCS